MCGIKYGEISEEEISLTYKVFTDLKSLRVKRIIEEAEKALKEAINQNNTPKNKS